MNNKKYKKNKKTKKKLFYETTNAYACSIKSEHQLKHDR